MRVAEDYSDPTVWLSIADEPSGRDAVLILMPEHVTVRRHGQQQAEHLYLWRPGKYSERVKWISTRNSLEYERDFAPGIHFLARVSLQSDGVLLHYEFGNESSIDFDSVQAVSDPRMVSPLLRDVRLQRTYVHEAGRWALLASDVPSGSRCR